MSNIYNSANKYFDIDTDIDEAGLSTLKGTSPDSNDSIFVFNSATATLAGANSLNTKKVYLGDNYAGTAPVKTGHCTIYKPGYTVTLYDTATNSGLDGEGSTSKYTIKGSSVSSVTVKSNTANTCSDYNVRGCPCDYQYAVFDSFNSINIYSILRLFDHVTIKNSSGSYSWLFYCEPGKFENCGVEDIGANTRRIHINGAISTANFNYLLKNFKVVNSGAAAGSRQWSIDEPAGTTYFRIHRADASLDEGEIYEKIFQIVQILLATILG